MVRAARSRGFKVSALLFDIVAGGFGLAPLWRTPRKLQARFFAGAYVSAGAAAANAHRVWRMTPAVLEQADYQLYAALTRAALCDVASAADRTQHEPDTQAQRLKSGETECCSWAKHRKRNGWA